MHYDVIITQNIQILSVKSYFFSNIKSKLFCWFYFFFLNVKCEESASQKDITDVMPFQYHVDIDIQYILNQFPLLEIMIFESTCLRVKDIDLYIMETACKFIKVNLILFSNTKSFYLINNYYLSVLSFFILALSILLFSHYY